VSLLAALEIGDDFVEVVVVLPDVSVPVPSELFNNLIPIHFDLSSAVQHRIV
jgi:hypothetical protein